MSGSADWTIVTLTNAIPGGGLLPYQFFNIFPQAITFEHPNVQVAVMSVSYRCPNVGTPTDYQAFVNLDCVLATNIIGTTLCFG